MSVLKELRRQEREQEVLRRKEQVLDAAFDCFVRYGIENTAIAEIAAAASVGEATVYRYFVNKENMAIACGIRFWQQTEQTYGRLLEDEAFQRSSGLEQIRTLMETAERIFHRDRDGFRFLHDFDGYLLAHRVGPEKLTEYEQRIDCLRPCLCNAIEKGRRDGSVNVQADTEELYYTLTNTIFGLMQKLGGAGELLSSDSAVAGERKLHLLLKLLLAGLQTRE